MTCAFTLGLGAVFSLLPHPQQENHCFHVTDHTHAKAGVNGGAVIAKAAFTFNLSAMRNLLLLVMAVVLVGCAAATLSDSIIGKRIHFSPPDENRTRWIQLNVDGTIQDGGMKNGKYEVDGLTLNIVGEERGKVTAAFSKARVAKGDRFTASEGGKDFVFIVRKVDDAVKVSPKPRQDSNGTEPRKTKD